MNASVRRHLVVAALLLPLFASLPLAARAVAEAAISVDSAAADDAVAEAGGGFANGWQWTIRFTLPESERRLRLKFADPSNGDTSFAASGNIRYFSDESDHGSGDPLSVTGNDYAAEEQSLVFDAETDLDPETPGRQVDVVVQVRVPEGVSGEGFALEFDAQSDTIEETPPADTTPPVIIVSGRATVIVPLEGGPYVDAGATATDDTDGDITGRIVVGGLPIDTSVEGTYTVTYDVDDAAGNHAIQQTRTVIVREIEEL